MCVLVCLLFHHWFCSPSRSSSRFFLRKLHPYYCRSERDIDNVQHSTDRAISSAQVARAIFKSLVALNHGPLSASFTFISWNLPCASVAGGVSRPRSGALVHNTLIDSTTVRFCPPQKTGFMVSVHRFVNITLLTLVQASSIGRPGGVSGYPRAWYRSVS